MWTWIPVDRLDATCDQRDYAKPRSTKSEPRPGHNLFCPTKEDVNRCGKKAAWTTRCSCICGTVAETWFECQDCHDRSLAVAKQWDEFASEMRSRNAEENFRN